MQKPIILLTLLSFVLIGCNQPSQAKPLVMEAKIIEHQTMVPTGTQLLSSVPMWVTSAVYDAAGNDVTEANTGFVGLAAYNDDNTYEFFTLDKSPRGDRGQFYITDNGLRVLYSETLGYFRVVPVTELTSERFTYKITNSQGQDIWVEHTPLP